MDPFALVTDLQDRLDWELSADELRIAATTLEDASDLARAYGRDWGSTTAPRLVRTLVLQASARYMRNPDGYTQSRAGDETVGWSDTGDRQRESVSFTDAEIALLAELAGKTKAFGSVGITAYGPVRRQGHRQTEGYVPVYNGGSPEKPFPLFSEDRSPW